jgi:hypothetical protein
MIHCSLGNKIDALTPLSSQKKKKKKKKKTVVLDPNPTGIPPS